MEAFLKSVSFLWSNERDIVIVFNALNISTKLTDTSMNYYYTIHMRYGKHNYSNTHIGCNILHWIIDPEESSRIRIHNCSNIPENCY